MKMKNVIGFIGVLGFLLLLGGCTPNIETKDLTANDWIIEGKKKDDPDTIVNFSDHVVAFSIDTSSIPSSSKDEWEALGEEFAKQLLDHMSYKFEYTLKDNTMVWKKDGKISKKDAAYTVAKDEKNLVLTPKDSKDKKDNLILKPYAKKSEDSTKISETSSVKNLVKETTTTSSKEKATGDFVETASDAFFDGTTLKGNTYTIKITKHAVIQPGETGNEYGEKPVIAFWYDTLVNPTYDNNTPVNPMTAWIINFKAIQDNDPNSVNELNVASLPDQQFLDSQTQDIKPGGTVSNAVAYELDDSTTPVTLVAENGLGKEFGKTEIPLSN